MTGNQDPMLPRGEECRLIDEPLHWMSSKGDLVPGGSVKLGHLLELGFGDDIESVGQSWCDINVYQGERGKEPVIGEELVQVYGYHTSLTHTLFDFILPAVSALPSDGFSVFGIQVIY